MRAARELPRLTLAVPHERAWAWWPLGACLGIGLLAKYHMALLGVSAVIFILLDPPSRRWLRRPEPYAAALLAAVLLTPVIVWDYQHDWASFSFQSARRLGTRPGFAIHWLALHFAILLTPVGLVAAIGVLLPGRFGLNGPTRDDRER